MIIVDGKVEGASAEREAVTYGKNGESCRGSAYGGERSSLRATCSSVLQNLGESTYDANRTTQQLLLLLTAPRPAKGVI